MSKLFAPVAAVLALMPLACAVAAGSNTALDAPPPYAGDIERADTAKQAPQRDAKEDLSIAPTENDMRKAREARDRGTVPPRNNDRKTRIDTVRDPNNHVTEYVVTPGSTKIPYKIENRADRPIDTTPGKNPSGTLGTPKLIEFGW